MHWEFVGLAEFQLCRASRIYDARMVANGWSQPAPVAPGESAHPREWWALFAVSIGLLPGMLGVFAAQGYLFALPGLGLGVVLTSRSKLWTEQQKRLVAAIPLLSGAGLAIVAYTFTHFTMEGDSDYAPPWEVALVWAGFLSLFIVPSAIAIYLNRAARRAAQADADRQRALRVDPDEDS